VLASGAGNVEASTLGVWEGADPSADYELRIVLTDSWGRSLSGNARVLGGSIPAYPSPSPDDAVTVTRE
jgi:hypothetical protein